MVKAVFIGLECILDLNGIFLDKQATDTFKQGIFEGNPDSNWGDIGATYVVDACNGIGGPNDLENEESFYRKLFPPRFIKDTSENAYYNFFVRQNIKIDFLFIDREVVSTKII